MAEKPRKKELKQEEQQGRGGEAMVMPRGINWTASITGWVVAFFTGMILTAVVGAILTGFGNAVLFIEGLAIEQGIVGIVIWFLAFLIGGLYAGRIARKSALLHSFIVWMISILFYVILLVLSGLINTNIAIIGGINFPVGADIASAVAIGTGVLLIAQLIGVLIGGWLSTLSEKYMS